MPTSLGIILKKNIFFFSVSLTLDVGKNRELWWEKGSRVDWISNSERLYLIIIDAWTTEHLARHLVEYQETESIGFKWVYAWVKWRLLFFNITISYLVIFFKISNHIVRVFLRWAIARVKIKVCFVAMWLGTC